jgi:cytoplasmic iron level regulating protein YaaA (DUF328/UPF0246 family)
MLGSRGRRAIGLRSEPRGAGYLKDPVATGGVPYAGRGYDGPVLIVVPPSETKRPPPEDGPPVDLASLSFPELAPTRDRILDALVETSAGADAFRRLGVRPTLAHEVARNTWLREQPARPVLEVYAGPLHEGLGAASLTAGAAARARDGLVVTSALWGALRPADRIPAYRLHICGHLVGVERLEPAWREVLPGALATAAGEAGLVVDFRSPPYLAAGMAAGLADRTVVVAVSSRADGRTIGDVVAKRIRGEAARHLLETGGDPADPGELASVLGERWGVDLEPPSRPGRPWRAILHAGG